MASLDKIGDVEYLGELMPDQSAIGDLPLIWMSGRVCGTAEWRNALLHLAIRLRSTRTTAQSRLTRLPS